MSEYRFELRKELVQFQDDIKRFAVDDLASVTARTSQLLTKYHQDPEKSWAARENFYQTLYQINAAFHKQYRKKGTSKAMKAAGFFGVQSKKETSFLTVFEHLKKLKDTATNNRKSSWHETNYQLSTITNLVGGSLGASYLRPGFGGRKQEIRLGYCSHRLMRDEAFSSKEYPHFHGLPFSVSAYKLKRDIEKFIAVNGSLLTYAQKANLQECVSALNRFLQIEEWILISKNLSLNNISEKLNSHEHWEENRRDDIIFHINHALGQMNPGERLLVPHGYTVADNSGHAALVEFECQPNIKYKVSFINTGSGVDEQTRGFLNYLKLNIFGILHIGYVDGVDNQAIINKQLIAKILDPIILPKPNQEDGVRAMNAAVNCFGDAIQQTNHTINLQLNGTCSFSCWIEWLGWRVEPGLFQALDLFINQRALSKLQTIHKDPHMKAELKRGIPELETTGEALVAKNRKDLSGWLDGNRDHQTWASTRAIADKMGVQVGDKPKTILQRLEEDNKETQDTLDRYFGLTPQKKIHNNTGSYGFFTRFAAVSVAAAAAALFVYSMTK